MPEAILFCLVDDCLWLTDWLSVVKYDLPQTTLSSFQKPDFSVSRQHEDFIWLHDTLVETEDYAGLIVSLPVKGHLTIEVTTKLVNDPKNSMKSCLGGLLKSQKLSCERHCFVYQSVTFCLDRSLLRLQSQTLRVRERRCTSSGRGKPPWPRRSTPRWNRS